MPSHTALRFRADLLAATWTDGIGVGAEYFGSYLGFSLVLGIYDLITQFTKLNLGLYLSKTESKIHIFSCLGKKNFLGCPPLSCTGRAHDAASISR
jgi:hypothetical protein